MDSSNWYYSQDQKTFGPFSPDTLRQMVNAGVLTPGTLVAREGQDFWLPFEEIPWEKQSPPPIKDDTNIFTKVAGKVSQASGLEKLEGFSLKKLFSQVFQHHSPEEIEEHFIIGTARTTPALNEVSADWPTPWAFVRLLFLSIAASIGFYYAVDRFQNAILIPGWIFVGCFGIPFAVLVFFMEANILRNVSFYRVLSLMFFGGLLSLIVSLFLFEFTRLGNWLGAMSAGLVEESGKLLAVIFFTRKWRKFGWTLNGLLFGAAVGTGFSAFESAGYVFVAMHQGGNFGSETTMVMRAFLSPFTHTIWTAATAAALWRIKRDQLFAWDMLKDMRFARIFLLAAGLHLLWNSPLAIPIIGGDTGYFGLRIIIGIIGWMIIFPLIQTGIREVRTAQTSASHPPA